MAPFGKIAAVSQQQNPYEKWGVGAAGVGFGGAKGTQWGEPGGGTTTTGGIQAQGGAFDWRSLDKFDSKIGQTAQPAFEPKVATPSAQVGATGFNPFDKNVEAVSPVPPASQVAKNGNNPQLQQALAGLGTGELSPAVGAQNNNWMKDFYA